MKFCRDKSTDRVKQTTYLFWHRDRCSHHKFYIILQLNLFVKYQNETTLTQVPVVGKKVIRACLRSSSSKYHLPNKKF